MFSSVDVSPLPLLVQILYKHCKQFLINVWRQFVKYKPIAIVQSFYHLEHNVLTQVPGPTVNQMETQTHAKYGGNVEDAVANRQEC